MLVNSSLCFHLFTISWRDRRHVLTL